MARALGHSRHTWRTSGKDSRRPSRTTPVCPPRCDTWEASRNFHSCVYNLQAGPAYGRLRSTRPADAPLGPNLHSILFSTRDGPWDQDTPRGLRGACTRSMVSCRAVTRQVSLHQRAPPTRRAGAPQPERAPGVRLGRMETSADNQTASKARRRLGWFPLKAPRTLHPIARSEVLPGVSDDLSVRRVIHRLNADDLDLELLVVALHVP